jgi:hypothetical protein
MIGLSATQVESVASPPLVPGAGPIDFQHLTRMTLGDRVLELEVLQLFDRQAEMLTGRMRGASAAIIAASAHTLNGSARGIGAWRMAEAAQAVERAAHGEAVELPAVVGALQASIAEVRVAIAGLLRAH